jgi:parallel beta-helix repeat protein
MNRTAFLIRISFLGAALAFLPGSAAVLTWNLKTQYGGITQPNLARAIGDAKAHFLKSPNDTIVIEFDAGTYPLAAPTNNDKGIFEISGVKPGPEGRLVFRGAGMDKTTLVFSPAVDEIHGHEIYRVSFFGLHLTRKDYTVSQGHVVQVGPGYVDLDIQDGFPTPKDIYTNRRGEDRAQCWLRRYTDSRTDPQIILDDNVQLHWISTRLISGRRWRMNLGNPEQVANYKPGDLIGIKSKHGGQAYWLSHGSDFVFEDVKWTQESRGVFRNGFDKIRISRCVVARAPAIDGQVPCLSTPDGGPQLSQLLAGSKSGNLVEDCSMTATGDDSIAFYRTTGTIRNCRISDSFARGILLCDSASTKLENNTLIRSVILKVANLRPRDRSDASAPIPELPSGTLISH